MEITLLSENDTVKTAARIPGIKRIRSVRSTIRAQRDLAMEGKSRFVQDVNKSIAKKTKAGQKSMLDLDRDLTNINPDNLGMIDRHMLRRRTKQNRKLLSQLEPVKRNTTPKVVSNATPKVIGKVTKTTPGKPPKGKKQKTYFTPKQFKKITLGGGALFGGGYMAGAGSNKQQQKYNAYY